MCVTQWCKCVLLLCWSVFHGLGHGPFLTRDGWLPLSFPQNASKTARPEVTSAISSNEVCFGDREKEEPPSPIEASPPRSFLEKVSKKKTPKTMKIPKPSKVPKPPKSPKPPKPPKSLKLKDGSKKKGKKCRGSASPTIPNLDLLEAHTKEALTKIEPPKKAKVSGYPPAPVVSCPADTSASRPVGCSCSCLFLCLGPRADGLCPSLAWWAAGERPS